MPLDADIGAGLALDQVDVASSHADQTAAKSLRNFKLVDLQRRVGEIAGGAFHAGRVNVAASFAAVAGSLGITKKFDRRLVKRCKIRCK